MNQSERRVAVTGIGVICPLGLTFESFLDGLYADQSGVEVMTDWQAGKLGLSTSLAAPVKHFDPAGIDRKVRRSMSRVAMLSHAATEQAVTQARLTPELLQSEETGVFYGSCMGGIGAMEAFYKAYWESGNLLAGASATTYLKIMPHTCAANIAVAFGVKGGVNASCTACSAGTQAIGFGFEAIKSGRLDRAICGGAEELSPSIVGIFDILNAVASGANCAPDTASRPFDPSRTGIVVGEGATTLILEDLTQARARQAPILAEVLGFYTNSDAYHLTNPSVDGLVRVMKGALKAARLRPDQIDYVNAHATGTQAGDQAESLAVEAVFGAKTPISSLKGHFGHMMGAAGAVEVAGAIGMMQRKSLLATRNHKEIDPECGKIDYIMSSNRPANIRYVMKNSFAFGGVNSSLVIATV